MTIRLTLAGALSVAALGLCGCASRPEPSGDISIMMTPDGSFVALDSSGTPSSDPATQLLAQVMNQMAADEAEAGSAAPLSESEVLRPEPGGHLTHIQSGAICAASIAGIDRTLTRIYAPDGTDVGCSYDGGSVAVTLYVYMRKSTIQDELEEALSAMRDRQPVSTDTAYAMEIPGVLSHTLAYERADGTAYRTSVLVTEAGGWKLKVRVTSPTSRAADMEYRAGIALMGQRDRLATGPHPPMPPANPT